MRRCELCDSRLVVVDQRSRVRVWACKEIRLNFKANLDRHTVYYECRKCEDDYEACGHGFDP